jgi:hypothetical protein
LAAFVPQCRADGPASTAVTLIKLTVTPSAAPTPALKYRLLPDLGEIAPGNPIQSYMKCMMEKNNYFFDGVASDRREKLLAMPLKELPAHDLYEYGQSTLSQVDRAARLDTPDWQILLKLKSDPIGVPLPELQQLRGLARSLKLRMRAEVALGRMGDAIRTAKTMFAMTRHLGEHPTLVGNLVGIAIAFQAIEVLDEMLEQPGCPNLYWALTHLPRPLVSVEKGFEGERMMILSVFRELDEEAPMTAEQIKKLLEPLNILLADEPAAKRTARAWLDSQQNDPAKLAAVHRRLAEFGLPEERLRRFPADQVILLDEKRKLEARFDDFVNTMSFPPWQAEPLALRIRSSREPALYADALVPITYSAQQSQGRLEQRIALLRNVEALRLYAAGHHGTPPETLAQLSVPLPDDPFTGKPFRFEVSEGAAHLHGSPPATRKNDRDFNVHYEVILRKQNN